MAQQEQQKPQPGSREWLADKDAKIDQMCGRGNGGPSGKIAIGVIVTGAIVAGYLLLNRPISTQETTQKPAIPAAHRDTSTVKDTGAAQQQKPAAKAAKPSKVNKAKPAGRTSFLESPDIKRFPTVAKSAYNEPVRQKQVFKPTMKV